jgi:apoptotic chromatin condensation inducer in the nucleus
VSDVSHTTIKLGVKVDCKTEQEEVLALPDAIELHADLKDADLLATAENMIPKNNFSVNTLMYGNGHGDPKCSNGDAKPFLCRGKDKVSEVKTDLDFQIKCVSIFNDNISTSDNNDVKGNLNADGCDLQLEAKQEIFKPSSTIPSPGDYFQVLDVDKELHKTGTSLQELGSTSNIDLNKEEESPDGSSREKLSLDKSSGDESMDEDVMESRHADSNIKPDDLGGKTVVTSEHVLEEVPLLDSAAESSSAHTNEVVAEEKPPSPAEKRKPEG